jgi:hypothetical protein
VPNSTQLDARVATEIAQLRLSTRDQLLAIWQKAYGTTAPQNIRRELLIPFLAYKIQGKAYGDLKPSTCSEIRSLARNIHKSPQPRIKTGTRLLREWRAHMHEVFVTEHGYEYRGVRYKSLSEIARKITGTRWSGPAFFGLVKRRTTQ